MVFTDLSAAGNPDGLHDQLSRIGFRRSQGIAYKPNCQSCNACIPVRVRVDAFQSSRNMKRVWRKGERIAGSALSQRAAATTEHYQLFKRYVGSRHSDGGMATMDFSDYVAMVQDTPVASRMIEYRGDDGKLVGACLTDILDDGLSLVYSFFDPDWGSDSFGTYMILWHIQEARRQGLPFVYLGYWIKESAKMSYKARFRPLEAYFNDDWCDFDDLGLAAREPGGLI
jgi:arginine-tRNA-protein transferase